VINLSGIAQQESLAATALFWGIRQPGQTPHLVGCGFPARPFSGAAWSAAQSRPRAQGRRHGFDRRCRCPNAMFSVLAPHAEMPPHTRETNTRLVVHLPPILPKRYTYRVGFEQRNWNEGKLLFFEDTIKRTACNDSDALRVVLIFDVWKPVLAPEERKC
jgi:hypothetical protein